MNFFLSLAHAQAEAPAPAVPGQPVGAPGMIAQLLPLIFIIVIFYFLLIRPQQQRQKQQRDLLSSLQKGDEVTTIGGIKGIITQVKEDEVTVEVANNVQMRFAKSAIASKKSQ